jgi:hypothetical protein
MADLHDEGTLVLAGPLFVFFAPSRFNWTRTAV